MFATSSQKNHWMCTLEKLQELRSNVHDETFASLSSVERESPYLISTADERRICQVVEETALKFCQTFVPPMPPSVVWTAFAYHKRFYLKHSVVEYIPKSIMMTSIYLACKVEEFNITIDDFVQNLKSGTKESNTELILSLELQLMLNLDYRLIVFTPHRPLEGHLISIKCRYRDLQNPERLRPHAEAFLWNALLTDVVFLYSPSQIALAALYYAARKTDDSLDRYINDVLCDDDNKAHKLTVAIQSIIDIVENVSLVSKDEGEQIMQKLRFSVSTLSTAVNQNRKDEDSDEDSVDGEISSKHHKSE